MGETVVGQLSELNNGRRPRVCVLAYDGLCVFEYSIAIEVFGLARPDIENWYELSVIAADKGEIRGLGNIIIDAPNDLSLLQSADIIIIPGWRGAEKPISDDLRNALIMANKAGIRIASICSGVFVLAQCGLLEGRKVTTHWRYSEKLQSLYPDVNINPDVLYVDEGLILTSAGSAAGMDLCLHIVRKDFGAQTANQVARRLVVPAHRDGGQAQFITRPMPFRTGDSIAPLLDQIRENLDKDWNVQSIADLAKTSSRTLQRRFKNATGHSPHVWLTMERVELAKDLLETTHLNIQQIADITGLKTPETFRHHFKIHTGSSPTKFRSKFNAIRPQ